jgi:AbrB family looped-hinge helix DNA binding protein
MSRGSAAGSVERSDSHLLVFRFSQTARPTHRGSAVDDVAIRARLDYLTFFLPDEAAMSAKQKLTTTVSTNGQVILSKAIRERRRWPAGTELTVEDTIDGVLLKAKPAFAPTRPKDVFGSLPYKGPAKSIAEVEAGIAAEAKRRHARNRY